MNSQHVYITEAFDFYGGIYYMNDHMAGTL